MADGVQARTIDELKENFDNNKIVGYFLEGKLQTWLTDRYYDEEAEQIAELRSDDSELAKKISKIFEIEYVEAEEVDVDKIASDNERIAKIKQFTDDEAIIKNYDKVAFTQEELADLYDAGIQTIYLCEGEFKIPKVKQELNYIAFGGAKTNLPEKKQEEPKIELPKECVEIITKLEEIIKTTREPQIYSDSVSTYVEDEEDWEYNFKSEEEAKTALTVIIKKAFDDVNSTTEAVYGAMIENYVNASLLFNLDKLKKLYNCAHEILKEKYNHEFDDETKKADIKNALQKLQERMNEKGRFDEVTERISELKYSSSDAFSNLDFYVSLCDIEKFDCEFDDGESDEYRYNSYNGICDIEKDANDYISLMENKITKTFDMEFDDVIYTEFRELVAIISNVKWENSDTDKLYSSIDERLKEAIQASARACGILKGIRVSNTPNFSDYDSFKKGVTEHLNTKYENNNQTNKMLNEFFDIRFRIIFNSGNEEKIFAHIDNSCDEGVITREFAEILKEYWRR